jgi:hypothetical protein
MLLRQLALVSESSGVSSSELTQVSAALQKQATRDFGPIWGVDATVDAFHKLEDVPIGYWPVIVMDDIGQPGAAGVHLDKDNQPYALVQYSENWALTASHETLEMLADPFGNRLMAGDSPKPDQGRVEFLVEVCDPCEDAQYGYTVNGITLSDFYTPSFFEPVRAPGVRYSYTGAVTEPREVLSGGYLSWHDPVSDHWWQEVYFGAKPEFRDLGVFSQKTGSLRSLIDRLTYPESLKHLTAARTDLQAAHSYRSAVAQATASKATYWRQEIAQLKAGASATAPTVEAAQPEIRRAPRKGKPRG